ncbi:Histone-Lysine N-Methyltransferase ash1l [Dissophora globulifera]|nr:Histone-Lysine N-Methyltransferase ash1l [Dissophora globulifera]
MLAVTRLLKKVDEKDALTVAKQILENSVDSQPSEESARDSDTENSGALAVNGAASAPIRVPDRSRPIQPRQTRTSARQQQEVTTKLIPPVKRVNGADTSEPYSNGTVKPKSSSDSTAANGPRSGVNASSSTRKQGGESWLADLTVANMKKQNLANEKADQRQQQEVQVVHAATNGSTSGGAGLKDSKRTFVSKLRSGLTRTTTVGTPSKPLSESEKSVKSTMSIKSPLSVKSDASYLASIITTPTAATDPFTPGAISVVIRQEGEPALSTTPSYEIPISALTRPRLTKTFIQEKARSTYAPASLAQSDQPRRRPGRPPGYFLGPTSCAYCRVQHRRCDYNTVCARCIKAKIPCDRSGTVERPSVIVREARQQARAEAAAALAVAVAAGLAVIPDKSPRSGQRYHDGILSDASGPSRMASTRSSAPRPAGVKRRRTPSPSDVTRDNIIEQRVKRVATVRSVEKYDPSAFSRQKRKLAQPSGSQPSSTQKQYASSSASSSRRGHSTDSEIDELETDEDDEGASSSKATSAGSPSKGKKKVGKPLGKAGSKTATVFRAKGARKLNLMMATKTRRGRPSNATRYARNPSLIPPPKLAKPKGMRGRPRKGPLINNRADDSSDEDDSDDSDDSDSDVSEDDDESSAVVVPSKRPRDTSSSKMKMGKGEGKGKGKGQGKGKGKGKGKQIAADSSDDESTKSSGVEEEEEEKKPVRLVRKAYLKSGLYSVDLKINPTNNSKLSVMVAQSAKSGNNGKAAVVTSKRSRSGISSPPGTHFQLPINYGAVLMSKQKDFCLPFDIMQAWQAGLLRKTMQPEPFTKIRSNIFLERKRRTETSPMVCHCTPPPPGAGRVGCGEDCYNRVMFYECISAHCPCGDQCSNQRFQKKHNEDHLQVIWTQERGFGIQTKKPIKKGSLVIEYRGEVISQNECHRRMETIYKNNKNFYFLEYEKGEVVDACQKGTNARFVNHSCSPNSQIEKWFLNGEMSIGIFASQDIPAGAEISYDYNFSSFSGAQKQKCRCGAPNCRGYIGERVSKNKEPANNGMLTSGRAGKKVDLRKRGSRRRKLNDQEPSSLRQNQMPTVRQIRQRQSDKYKEDKMAAIRYTKLLLFRNIRLVEAKYIKYARTKSRSYQDTVPRSWLLQARQCRKRSLEGVVDDLRAAVQEKEDEELRERFDELENGAESGVEDDGSDPSASVAAEESIVVELDAEEDEDDYADALDEYGDDEEGSTVYVEEETQEYELVDDTDEEVDQVAEDSD